MSGIISRVCRLLSDHRHHPHLLPSLLSSLPFSPTPSTSLHVLKRIHSLPLPAHSFFLWYRSLNPKSLNTPFLLPTLVSILASARLFPYVWSLLLDDPKPLIDRNLFKILFRAYCRAKLPSDAVRAIRKMPSFGLQPGPEDLNCLVFHLCANGFVLEADGLIKNGGFVIENEEKVRLLTVLMKGWVEKNRPENAVKVFEEMSERFKPDVVAFNGYMTALCKLGEFGKAEGVLGEMKRKGLEVGVASYAVLLRAYCGVGDFSAADRAMSGMRRLGLVPNAFSYNCYLKLLCRNKMVEKAYEVLDEMVEKRVGPDIWSYNAVLEVHCKQREVNKGTRLLDRMYKEGFCAPDLHSYNMLLKMLLEVGRIDRAMEVCDGMAKKGYHPNSSTYAVMIHGLCKKKGRIEDACDYFERMIDAGLPPYLNTCEVLRDCLLRDRLPERIYVARCKMQRSTSLTIQELSSAMEEKKKPRRGRSREMDDDEEEDRQMVVQENEHEDFVPWSTLAKSSFRN